MTINLALESGLDDLGPHVTLVDTRSGQRHRMSLSNTIRVAEGLLSAVISVEDLLLQQRQEVEAVRQAAGPAIATPPPPRIIGIDGRPIG